MNIKLRTGLLILVFLFSLHASAESVTGTINSITEDYGNLNTSVTASQLDELGILQGANYTLKHKGTKVSVYYGSTYSDVSNGEWVSFVLDDGTIRVARNFENAGATLAAVVGDEITISNLE
ncbi:MAG: SAM-dependent chlorinase/fluorinase [Pseudomonadales bacterium]|jgi:S-adenosylmethionine hydrolase|nr:hypothetical protein [Gammaproteobacteria bacterium]MDP6025104.1 SAM-dependent chlorinase/fluorinase [Pseudomonadales bacterium]MDP6315629.1 SAM-dependent chlorinase/fluorinase [Pseudomonadales bacterium]MDP7313541.1 SAM-dependent chlorinase/fluorinase [Pseudomonadales bacterium]MDP7576167.1 SAM-dependent chlorinase/fluorinase [Pseudomonadales bacterium]|tara:strand:+ start:2089 stop:2454 length:366 start_codon:yes stop_codon:yes gene_type:complete